MTDLITPQQADREAAWRLRPKHIGYAKMEAWLNGDHDDEMCIQVIAHHAQQARLEERERCARIADDYGLTGETGHIAAGEHIACIAIADAIRKGEGQ